MATGSEYWTIPGVIASSSLASYQYYPVKFSTTAGEVKLATADTDLICGILQNNPGAGEAAEVAYLGICKGKAGVNDIAAGEALTANTTGLVDTATGEKRIVGIAVTASAAVTDLITVMVRPGAL